LAIARSITDSRLLITLLLSARKHQLSDFFNTNAISRQLAFKSELAHRRQTELTNDEPH